MFFLEVDIQRIIAIVKCNSEMVWLETKLKIKLTDIFMQHYFFFTFYNTWMSSMCNLARLDSVVCSLSSSMSIFRLNHISFKELVVYDKIFSKFQEAYNIRFAIRLHFIKKRID